MKRDNAAGLLPICFEHYPGVVLELSAGGRVLASNGKLERMLEMQVVNSSLTQLIDLSSSGAKVERMLAAAALADGELSTRSWEFVFAGSETLDEPRSFIALWEASNQSLLLLERVRDPRLERLRDEATDVNSELSRTQRELLKERGRLAHTLEELEAQNQLTQELSEQITKQNEELRRSNSALDEFAHAISHDLKAPLRSIRNNAQWVEEDAADLGEAAREHLTRVQASADRLLQMISDVLDFARARKGHSHPEAIEVDEMVSTIFGFLELPKNLRIVRPSPLPTLTAERAPLQQVFLNLLANAVRYVDPVSPQIEITAMESGDFWEFWITDNGPGIPRPVQHRIWELFSSVDPNQTGGTGVGLALVRKHVEEQGGRAWVVSESGEGASFRFTWPRVQASHETGG